MRSKALINHAIANRRYRMRHPKRVARLQQAANVRWRKLHPARYARSNRKQRQQNHELRRILEQNRNARKAGTFTLAEWRTLKAFHGNKCLACGRSEQQLKRLGRLLVPDHVKPLCKGGRNTIRNLQPLCHGTGGCNNAKARRHVDYR